MVLGSEDLASTLAGYGDVIRLAIFAHTHMDEMRLLTPAGDSSAKPIALKMVPSISPVDRKWGEEYDYAQTYHRQTYSADDVKALIGEFSADGGAKSAESQSYLRDYFVGDKSAELAFI